MSEALKAFEEELQSKNFKGYWQNQQGDVYREPVASFEACFWKGKDLFAAMEKAGDVVGLDVSFRRVIQLWNPALKNGTSRTLVLNLQMLKPGENALSHRHMAGAIRFILKGHGTRLIVEGESFEIGEGDFVTTPSWTWHDHENRGETMMWLDGLDAPLVRLLETDFHEPDPRRKQTVTKPEGYTLATTGALRPAWVKPNSIQPPAFCYKWADTESALEQSRRAARRSLRRHRARLCQSVDRRPDPADDGLPDSHAARRRKNQEPPPHQLGYLSCLARQRRELRRRQALRMGARRLLRRAAMAKSSP